MRIQGSPQKPVDRMQQLVSILVALMPGSMSKVPKQQTGRKLAVSYLAKPQILTYLNSVLGDAPQPAWGLPAGWDAYIASEFRKVPQQINCSSHCVAIQPTSEATLVAMLP